MSEEQVRSFGPRPCVYLQRHAATSVWAAPQAPPPQSSLLAAAAESVAGVETWGDDLGDELGTNRRRQEAEERRRARQAQRAAAQPERAKPQRLAAQRVPD